MVPRGAKMGSRKGESSVPRGAKMGSQRGESGSDSVTLCANCHRFPDRRMKPAVASSLNDESGSSNEEALLAFRHGESAA